MACNETYHHQHASQHQWAAFLLVAIEPPKVLTRIPSQAIPDGLQGRDFPPLKSQPTWKGFSSNGSFKMTLTDGSLGKYSALLSKESPKAPPVDAGSKKKKLLKKQAPAGAHAQDVCNADTLVEVI